MNECVNRVGSLTKIRLLFCLRYLTRMERWSDRESRLIHLEGSLAAYSNRQNALLLNVMIVSRQWFQRAEDSLMALTLPEPCQNYIRHYVLESVKWSGREHR